VVEIEAEVDAAIVGGGPAGAATAIALARAGLRAAVIEASDYASFRVGETVPADLRGVLRELGAWESFAADAHLASAGNASAWGSGELEVRDALFDLRGHGWHLDRRRFDATLAAEAERAGARVWTRTRLTGWQRRDGAWSLSLSGPGAPQRLTAAFLVDATGRDALVARRCGARRLHRDRLVAVFGLFAWPEGAPARLHTLVEAAEDGWWYAARLPGGQAVVSWMSDSDLVRRGRLWRPGPWIEGLERTGHIRRLLAGAAPCTGLTVRSAASHCLDRTAGDGWIAVGDAACAFDPLASAGIVNGLRSGLAAAGALAQGASALAAYDESTRKRFTDFLAGRREQYSHEARWPASPFWHRRQEGGRITLHKGGSHGEVEDQKGPAPARGRAFDAAPDGARGPRPGVVAEPGVLGAREHRPGPPPAG
jgi:flavin-dependent dehydrogenase